MNSVTRLACAAEATRWEEIPIMVRDQATDLFCDTLAVISAGLAHPTYAPFVDAHSSTLGKASVPGLTEGVPALTAALINGGATTVLQLQDGHRLARGHPASHLVPALLSVAEEKRASCNQMMGAFVSGYEVGTRIGIALGGMNAALHDTGTWSTIATAVGVTHLLTGGNREAMAAAIEEAAAVAPMPYRETAAGGASVHHLYVGLGTTTGITVANAVVAGLSPLSGTLDAFFGPRAGAAYESEKLTQGIDSTDHWTDYELMNAYIKTHPTCAHLHGVNDAVARLIADHALSGDDIARVDIALYGAALEFENPVPTNDLSARFSVAATVAIALHYGELTISSLTNETLNAPEVKDLMKRVYVSHDPQLDSQYPEGRPSRVSIACHDGRELTLSVIYPLGDCTNPLGREARRSKARDLLTHRFGQLGAGAVLRAWDVVIDGGPVSSLSQVLRAPAVNG